VVVERLLVFSPPYSLPWVAIQSPGFRATSALLSGLRAGCHGLAFDVTWITRGRRPEAIGASNQAILRHFPVIHRQA
jgi:hypothetical protein